MFRSFGQNPLSNMAFLMLLRRLKRTDIPPMASVARFAIGRPSGQRFLGRSARPHSRMSCGTRRRPRTSSELFERRRALMTTWEEFANQAIAEVISETRKRGPGYTVAKGVCK